MIPQEGIFRRRIGIVFPRKGASALHVRGVLPCNLRGEASRASTTLLASLEPSYELVCLVSRSAKILEILGPSHRRVSITRIMAAILP